MTFISEHLLDIITVLLIIIITFWGYKKGILQMVISLAGFFAAAALAGFVSNVTYEYVYFKILHAVFALILDVMDREHGFDAAVLLQMSVIQVQIYGHQRRLPIVGVDDVRDEVHMKQHLQNGAGEKRKPLAVIVKAVQSSSFKIVFIVQKVIFYAVVRQFKQAAILVAPAYGNRKISELG